MAAALSVVQKEAPAQAIAPEEYFRLIEKLLAEGQLWERTKPVYAFMLSNLTFSERLKRHNAETGAVQQHVMQVANNYVVMCPEEYRSDYVRGLVVKDMMSKYADGIISVADINSPRPEFGGPRIWSSKQKAFEQAYQADQPLSDNPDIAALEKQRIRLYQPRPDMVKLCLLFSEAANVPMPWADEKGRPDIWPMQPEGALAVTEANLPALIDAVKAVRDAGASREAILEHLYKSEGGHFIPKIDVYGMEAGFLDNTHRIAPVKSETADRLAPYRSQGYTAVPVDSRFPQVFLRPPVIMIKTGCTPPGG